MFAHTNRVCTLISVADTYAIGREIFEKLYVCMCTYTIYAYTYIRIHILGFCFYTPYIGSYVSTDNLNKQQNCSAVGKSTNLKVLTKRLP